MLFEIKKNMEKFSGYMFLYIKKDAYLCAAFQLLTHGVIGNTADFGSVILGSSPSGSTQKLSSKPISQ